MYALHPLAVKNLHGSWREHYWCIGAKEDSQVLALLYLSMFLLLSSDGLPEWSSTSRNAENGCPIFDNSFLQRNLTISNFFWKNSMPYFLVNYKGVHLTVILFTKAEQSYGDKYWLDMLKREKMITLCMWILYCLACCNE